MTDKIDAQSRRDPGAPLVIDGGGPALSARVAEGCDRVSGQELAGKGERVRADLV